MVADANKPFLLETAGAVGTLVDGLLLDPANPKKGLAGAAEFQVAILSSLPLVL